MIGENDMAKIDTSRDDYISAIYECMEKGEIATNKYLAGILKLSAASVTEMIKKLVDNGDVYLENKSICLTEEGKLKARAYLTKRGLKDKLNEFLNKPKHCPHGNEIYENHHDEDKLKKLSELSIGTKCKVHKVDDDKDLLEYLEDKHISLGDEFIVEELDTFDSSVLVLAKNEKKHIAGKAAVRIMVERL